jgi:hypothetical protein
VGLIAPEDLNFRGLRRSPGEKGGMDAVGSSLLSGVSHARETNRRPPEGHSMKPVFRNYRPFKQTGFAIIARFKYNEYRRFSNAERKPHYNQKMGKK